MVIHTDRLHRIAYATDASVYREMPYGVAYPENEEDIRELIRYAREKGISLIPRAGGTSIAGQVVGDGLVVDISRHFTKILEVNAEERWAWVQPGVVRDELNLALQPYGLFFSPETSTSNRCCIGGMVGNNSCGTHSLVYGSTRHHLLQLKGYLSDGSFFDTALRGDGELEQRIYAQLEAWKNDSSKRKLIEDCFPDKTLRRRSCGYAIDEAIEDDIDLCKLICGSEGTLCFITEIKISLDPLPPKEQMVLCAHCHSLEDSFKANLTALKHNPVAVELMDGKILELGKGNAAAEKNRFFVEGDPAALLIAEFNGQDGELAADALEKELVENGLASVCTRVYGADVSRVWALRKAGLGVLSGMKGDSKPVGVIEDTAVAPERLPAYMADFMAMMLRIGLDCVYYGHIGTGELHLRPILNLKTAEGRAKFREVAEETALLVRKHRGSLSGEHGDGRLRGEFIPLMYGEEVYQLMRQVKQCWDPDGVFNMHKIVDAPPMDQSLRYDVNQTYLCPDQDLMCSIEQCNGAGDCRKSNAIGGTLCPSYKVSHDELLSTRARANILRELLTRGLPAQSDLSDQSDQYNKSSHSLIEEVLYSCLACKGCKGECPSNVDMTRIRAQVLQMLYDRHGTPFRSWMVARMAMVERLGHLVYPLYNYLASARWSSTVIKKIVSFAPEREIPALSPRTMRQLVNKESTNKKTTKKVYLFADEFTNLQEAELGLTFARLLTALGYQVIVPKHLESGRAAISKGCLHLASRFARQNVKMLRDIVTDETPLVGIEPSCILTFRDEYPDLVPSDMRDDATRLAQNCLLYDEFIMREVARGNICPEQFSTAQADIWLHGHCHQKALVGIEKTVAMLHLLKGCRLHVIPSSCCGMAGSFGYEKEHYQTSMAIGEMLLFPTVRKAVKDVEQQASQIPAIVAAPGTSCRQQILDGTGIHAVHPIEIMYRWLAR
jgi:FAD/FMN-containing dehydrogenase/Fe-S oxidoreductase